MKRLFPVICICSCLIGVHSFAGSATWSSNPISGDWNTAANWVPATVPNGPGDVATFSGSSITNVSLSGNILLSQLVFAADAAPYSIAVNAPFTVTFVGLGITNVSSITQHIDLNGGHPAPGSAMLFMGSSSAGSSKGTVITAHGGGNTFGSGAVLEFYNTSSAGNSTLIADGNYPGYPIITFFDQATAGTATISVTGQNATFTFADSSTAGQATISVINHSVASFGGTSNAGSANITLASVASLTLGETAYAGAAANIVAVGDGLGSFIDLMGKNDVPLDLGQSAVLQVGSGYGKVEEESLGSLTGDGIVYLYKGVTLSLGSNNLSTKFTGSIQDDPNFGGGGLKKVGTGSLTLSGFNYYSKGTTVTGGALIVTNTTVSSIGGGPVTVTAGTLGGRGIVSGAVTLGTGNGTGAIIAPSQNASNPTTITLQNLLTFEADGSYLYRLNTNKGTADQVIAKGVTIGSGAQFNFKTVGNKKLVTGTAFTAISNTAATPISGTFANLADGATVTLGRNKLQVSYSGGDGNDLTLTVVQ